MSNHGGVLTPLTLADDVVRLEPLLVVHARELAEAAAEDRSSYGYAWVPDGIADAETYVEAAMAQQRSGRSMAHVVRQVRDGRVVGATRFLDLDVFTEPTPGHLGTGTTAEPDDEHPPSALEIGSTWYAATAQRTGVNRRVKLLQLTQAFDVWRVLRVTFKTDARNGRSRQAIERLGAHCEGVRRVHVPATDGTVRDSAYYSIVATEWPGVRRQLVRSSGQPSTWSTSRARSSSA